MTIKEIQEEIVEEFSMFDDWKVFAYDRPRKQVR